MRFAQLGLITLPKHREWTAGGEAQEHLRSQIAKVLSRLEIIKLRMDEEEIAKLRARMLAQAEEETQRQNRFHQEQELWRIVLGDKENQWNGKYGVTLRSNDRQVKNSTTVAAEVEAMEESTWSNHSKNIDISKSDEITLSSSLWRNPTKPQPTHLSITQASSIAVPMVDDSMFYILRCAVVVLVSESF
jgi:hypothetical protein